MASSSSFITSINSALDVVDFLLSHDSDYIFERGWLRLRNLKIFVLLARKFGTDVHLGSLLISIEDVFTRSSLKILPNSLGSEDSFALYGLFDRVSSFAADFQHHFESLKKGVHDWYIATSDNKRRSNSLTADEVGEISESILENLVHLSRFSLALAEVMETLREHMNFLKNFCRFATSRGVDHGQMKDFLAHTEAVAISAAHLCFLCDDY